MFHQIKQQNAAECSEIAPGLPGTISEHSGVFVVSFIGTVIGVIPIPGAFLKSIPGKIFAFPMTTVCVWISATQPVGPYSGDKILTVGTVGPYSGNNISTK